MEKDTEKIFFKGDANGAAKAIIEKMQKRGIIGRNTNGEFETICAEHLSVNWREETDVKSSKILVSGGRGIQSASFYDELQVLADILNGEVTSSRANVVSGWITSKRQVGSTGNIVEPDLYLSIGISGTDQHKAGMRKSKCIIAINKNEMASIFEIANLSVAGDAGIIVPALITELNEYKLARD